MRLSASRACSCVARALVSPARDAEHREAGMHIRAGEARDEGPEVGLDEGRGQGESFGRPKHGMRGVVRVGEY